MNDREEDSRGVDIWHVDQGGSRYGLGEVEGKHDTGRGWP